MMLGGALLAVGLAVRLVISFPLGRDNSRSSPRNEEAVRICLDVGDVVGPDWYRRSESDRGDLFLSELALRMSRRLLPGSKVQVFGIEQVYDVLDPKRPFEEIVEATHFLRVISFEEGTDARMRFVLERLSDSPGRQRVERLSGRTTRDFAFALRDTLSEAKLPVGPIDLLSDYYPYPIEDLCRTTQASFYRLLGRRYGSPNEARLIKRAESFLDEYLSPGDHHTDAAIEKALVLFRRWNMEGNPACLQEGTKIVHEFEDIGLQSPRFQIVRALYKWADDAAAARGLLESRFCLGEERPSGGCLEPSQTDAWFLVGYLNSEQKLKWLAQAKKDNPAHLRARTYLAKAYADAGDFEEAARVLHELFQIRDYPLGHFQAAVVAAEQGRRKEAYGHLTKLDNSGFYPGDYYRLRTSYELEDGKLDAAERGLVEWITREDAETRARYGQALQHNSSSKKEIFFQGLYQYLKSRDQTHGESKDFDGLLLALFAAQGADLLPARDWVRSSMHGTDWETKTGRQLLCLRWKVCDDTSQAARPPRASDAR